MEDLDRSDRVKALLWACVFAPLAGASLFWLILHSEGGSRSGSPVGELFACLLVSPFVTLVASHGLGVPSRLRPRLAVASILFTFPFGLLILLGIELFFGSST